MSGVIPKLSATSTLNWYFLNALMSNFKMLRLPMLAAWNSAVLPFLSLEFISKFPASSKNNATMFSLWLSTAVDRAERPLVFVASIFAPRFNKLVAIEIARESLSRKHSWIKAVFPFSHLELTFTPEVMNPRACLKRRSEIALFNAAILQLSFCRAGGVV